MFYERVDFHSGMPIIDVGYNCNIILSSELAKNSVDLYTFTFRLRLDNVQIYLIADWASKNCMGEWLIGCQISGFNNKEDAVLFKLTWC
jgi:hypothetical protein